MNSEIDFKEQLNKLRESEIIEIKDWGGIGPTPGYGGTIVTNNKEIYKYQYYHRVPENFKEIETNYIRKVKDLTDDEYNKVILFIKEEIADKEFEDFMIFDAGWDVVVNYNGINKIIRNNKGFGDVKKIYDKAEMLIQELLK